MDFVLRYLKSILWEIDFELRYTVVIDRYIYIYICMYNSKDNYHKQLFFGKTSRTNWLEATTSSMSPTIFC